ncbi:12129_t:CDS:1 [Funneliformis mosseae]|uniref:12129_t:CDS:1 n=1 Tax=Funneliformis mosseae TaxID=27381 RepID=A0A9N8V9H4_FUNMO|nr:12129_t:CDS:1 [Funneliformis mosseae]
MKGSWRKDEDDLVVEVCSFPLIYSDTNGLKTYTPAKVLPVYVVGYKIKKTITGIKSAENNQFDQEESNDKNDKSPPHQFYLDESDYYYPTEATNDGTYY